MVGEFVTFGTRPFHGSFGGLAQKEELKQSEEI
jgi:hypothetical protein